MQPLPNRSVNNPFADSDQKIGATPREPSANNPFVDNKEVDEPMHQHANDFGSASILDNLIEPEKPKKFTSYVNRGPEQPKEFQDPYEREIEMQFMQH